MSPPAEHADMSWFNVPPQPWMPHWVVGVDPSTPKYKPPGRHFQDFQLIPHEGTSWMLTLSLPVSRFLAWSRQISRPKRMPSMSKTEPPEPMRSSRNFEPMGRALASREPSGGKAKTFLSITLMARLAFQFRSVGPAPVCTTGRAKSTCETHSFDTV